MSAIAATYNPFTDRFVIAADGRIVSEDDPPKPIREDRQKIFFAQTPRMIAVYALTGYTGTVDRSFDVATEVFKQITMLSKRKFSDGNEFVRKLSFNVTRVIEKVLEDRRIEMPHAAGLPEGEDGISKLFMFGYFNARPFWRTDRFYYDKETHRICVSLQSVGTDQFRLLTAGSETIHRMVYGLIPIDARIAAYAQDVDRDTDAFTLTTSYIRACSDPAALEIDPWCIRIGGHMHAAEITKRGFKWLIPPLSQTVFKRLPCD
jgi:hypothetical protein